MKNIPLVIRNLVAEATSNHNDGWVKRRAKESLIEVRDYINNTLAETYTCARCGRELVVMQHLDYVDLPDSKGRRKPVCIPCVERN